MSRQHQPVMTFERATEILDVFGASHAAWPARERSALLALMDRDQELKALWEEMIALDRVLQQSASVEPSEKLMMAILADAADIQAEMQPGGLRVPGRSSVWQQMLELLWPYGSPTIPAGALAASVILGVGVGVLSVNAQTTGVDDSAYEMVAYAVGDTTLVEEWQ